MKFIRDFSLRLNAKTGGFTLVELSIVIVVIGLLIGAVLAGQDLIHAALVRAQISQIEKYQTAVRTFQMKYNCLPGDCINATAFGFSTDGSNGNGIIQRGVGDNGEAGSFWTQLGQAALINGSYKLVDYNINTTNDGSKVSDYLPRAKLSANLYLYVWSAGIPNAVNNIAGSDRNNYFSLAEVRDIHGSNTGDSNAYATIQVLDAYNLDRKIDDGLPQSGNVQAFFWTNYCGQPIAAWVMSGYDAAYGNGCYSLFPANPPATIPNNVPTNCYDSNGVAGGVRQYSTRTYPNNPNCALSFKFQ